MMLSLLFWSLSFPAATGLGHDAYVVREAATQFFNQRPALDQALVPLLLHRDLEVARRASDILKKHGRDLDFGLYNAQRLALLWNRPLLIWVECKVHKGRFVMQGERIVPIEHNDPNIRALPEFLHYVAPNYPDCGDSGAVVILVPRNGHLVRAAELDNYWEITPAKIRAAIPTL